jgi:uridine kinase
MTRAQLLDELAGHLLARDPGHPLRVGIDGWCGAGKTTFRRALADRLRTEARPVVELDSDGFHHMREIRYRQGRGSARGYYEDAYDFSALERLVLRPLGPGGDRHIAAKVHDLATDQVDVIEATVDPDAVVLFDCTFIQRGTLRDLWDELIYLDVQVSVARARGIARDAPALGGFDAAADAYDMRYLAACRIYRDEEDPSTRASILIDNTVPDYPRLVRGPETATRRRRGREDVPVRRRGRGS